jgi:uncharacterized protein YecE (DUF72 family)
MIRIGISGWRYEPWRGIFYPKDLAQKRELEFASSAFNSIELNGSFIRCRLHRAMRAGMTKHPMISFSASRDRATLRMCAG